MLRDVYVVPFILREYVLQGDGFGWERRDGDEKVGVWIDGMDGWMAGVGWDRMVFMDVQVSVKKLLNLINLSQCWGETSAERKKGTL